MDASLPLIQEKPTLLSAEDPDPVGFQKLDSNAPFILFCDHSGNAIPKSRHHLGLPSNLLEQHIALDIGIFGVCQHFSNLLKIPFIFQRYSRLVIDCNRLLDTPYSIPEKSDGIAIPGNQNIDETERTLRQKEIFYPYHHTIETFLNQRQIKKKPTIILSLHSFTPILKTEQLYRLWEIGLLYENKSDFIEVLLNYFQTQTSFEIGDNKPYSMQKRYGCSNYTLPIHAQKRHLPYIGIEIRQDLIVEPRNQKTFGALLGAIFLDILQEREKFLPEESSS